MKHGINQHITFASVALCFKHYKFGSYFLCGPHYCATCNYLEMCTLRRVGPILSDIYQTLQSRKLYVQKDKKSDTSSHYYPNKDTLQNKIQHT